MHNKYAMGAQLCQSVFDAMVLITFNMGRHQVSTSTMHMNASERESVCNELPCWNTSDGKMLNGLVVFSILFDIKSTYLEFGNIKIELSQVKLEFNQHQTLAQKVSDIDNKFTKDLDDAKACQFNRLAVSDHLSIII